MTSTHCVSHRSPILPDCDLRIIEGNLRDPYRLIYQPAELKRGGSFHRIGLRAPERVDSITIRAGYYAPSH